MKTSNAGIELIKHFESLHDGDLKLIGLQPKMCPAGLWTEGYGRLVLDDKGQRIAGVENKAKAYKFSRIKTEAQALAALKEDLTERESMVNGLCLVLTQGQFDALVSFVYNVGFANLKSSILLKLIKTDPANPAIRNEFAKWKYANKKELPGLVRRRAAEADLYFKKS